MKLIGTALAVAVMAFSVSPAFAFGDINFHNYYVELKTGAGAEPHPEVEITGFPTGEYRPDKGYSVGGAVGAYVAPLVRAEIEFSWIHAEDGVVDFGPGFSVPHSGEVDVYNTFVNVYREFDLHEWFRPFVGAGVGFGVYDVQDHGAIGGGFVTDDTDVVFQSALHIGFDVPLNEMLVISTRYTGGISTKGSFDTTLPGTTTTKDTQFFQFLSLGLRVHMN